MSAALVVLGFAGTLGLLVMRSLLVDEFKGRLARRITAIVETTIAALPAELQAEWADEWRGELAAVISMPVTAMQLARGLRQSAHELTGVRPLPRRWLGSRDERWAMAQFAVSGLVAVAVVLVLVLVAFGRTGRGEAIDSAKEITQIGAHGVVEPALTQAVLDGDRLATARLDRAVRMSLLREPVLRVVVWDPSGRIVYSTQHGAASRRVPPNAVMRRALRTGTTQSKADEPPGSGNGSSKDTRLLDVYEPISVAGGQRLIVQSRRRLDSVSADSRALLSAFAPYVIGGVLLLQLVNLPLALRLIRRFSSTTRSSTNVSGVDHPASR